MTAIRLAVTELRRLTAGLLPKIAIVALVLVPTLYGGLYLYANKDPYAHLDRVPAALVVEDRGTTLATGEHLEVGPRVAGDLTRAATFDWHRVSRAQAQQGVSDDRYDFALVLPKDFSADLASSADFRPRRAMLELVTNDANNYLAHTIADTLVGQVSRSVAQEVSQTAANTMLLGFSTIHDKVAGATEGAQQLASGAHGLQTGAGRLVAGTSRLDEGAGRLAGGADQLVDGQRRLADGSERLTSAAEQASSGARAVSSGARQLDSGLATLDERTAALPGKAQLLAAGARQVAEGNRTVAAAGDRVARLSGDLVTRITSDRSDLADWMRQQGFTDQQVQAVLQETQRLSGPVRDANGQVQQTAAQLDELSRGADRVASGTEQLATSAGQLQDGIHRAHVGAGQLAEGAGSLAAGADQLASGARSLREGQRSALAGAQRLQAGAKDLQSGAERAHEGASSLENGAGRLEAGATQLHDALAQGLKSIPNPSATARTAVAQTLGHPVGVADRSLASAGSYGAGLAPFFLSLALWIGAYVLFLLVRPYSTRALAAGQPAWRVALGGWLPPALVGMGQALLVFAVVALWLRLPVAHAGATIGLLFLTSVTFVALVQLLVARLGAVGKFLGLVLLVLQLVSAGGTFPWQTLPGPLRVLHHVLPMSYAIDGVRHLMYGGSLTSVGLDVGVLLAYLAVGLLGATAACARARIWTAARIRPELVL